MAKYLTRIFLFGHLFQTCRILNIEYLLLFSPGRCSGKNQNKCSKFEIQHVQINELPRTKDRNTPSEFFMSHCVPASHFTDHAARNSATYIKLTYHILLVTKSRLTAFLVQRNLFLVILCIGLALLVLCHDNHKIMLFVDPCPF